MTLRHLALAYAVVGVAAALGLYRHERRLGSALLCVPLWPLWLPVALSADADEASGPLGERVRAAKEALRETSAACAEAGLGALFTADAARALAAGLDRTLEKILRMDRLLAAPAFDATRARARLARLEAEGAGRAADLARAQAEHAERLGDARARQALALEELLELVGSLRTQVLLVGVAGGGADADALSEEIRCRIEALAAALGPEPADDRAVPRAPV